MHADLLSVTVTDTEAKAVIQVFQEYTHRPPVATQIGDRIYHDFDVVNGTRVVMVQSAMGAVAPGASLQTVEKAIEAVSPSAIIMVGIAFGVDDKKQAIGDILVSERLELYESQRVGINKEAGLHVIARGDRPRASQWLINRFRSAGLYWDDSKPKLHFGGILSGEKLVDNQTFLAQLRTYAPEAIGGEMEAAGLYAACEDHKIDWILVKAICDWADGNKDQNKSDRQRIAAHNAAEFVLHVIKQAPLKRPCLPPSISSSRESQPLRRSSPAAGSSALDSTPDTQRSLHRQPNQALHALLQGTKWIVGAVNLDEDLHFSSFYLRMSCRRYLHPNLIDFGYSKIVAIYQDFNERYYLPEQECKEVAERLVRRMLNNPDWFQHDILDEIHKRADALARVFTHSDPSHWLATMADKEILQLYRKHNRAHLKLYEVARIPETLDRGVGFFTEYLRAYLRARLRFDITPRQMSEYFDVLTYPEEQSKKVEEIQELFQLVQQIKERYGQDVLTRSSRRMLLELDPSLLRKIEDHRDKWSFWGYHGYGSRATYDILHYLDQIADAGTCGIISGVNPNEYHKALKQAEERRKRYFTELGVDDKHQLLFRFYSRIGNAKVTRRYMQLRNFYLLDLLIREISRRTALSEAVLRSLLPEEIEVILKNSKKVFANSQSSRSEYAIFIITENDEIVLSGKEFSWVELELEKSIRAECDGDSGTSLHGYPLCPGIARGRVKIINRREDALKVGFRKGDILVSQSADPELADLIGEASGVLVETGGVTCHAAIVCRELGKPGISSIQHLLQELHNDDYVIVDAFLGTVEVRKPRLLSYLKLSIDITDADASQFGNKTVTLSRLLRSGINVPSFFAIPISQVKFLDKPQDAVGPERDQFIQEVKEGIDVLQESMFMVRSSMRDEDRDRFTNAGQYISESNVDKEDLVTTILHTLYSYATLPRDQCGSIIIQDMILGDYSGVCFTNDPINNRADRMLIEVVPGGNELLTSGEVSPQAYYYDRNNHVLEEAKTDARWCRLIDGDNLRRIADTCQRIEQLFGQPQDIEWTLKGDQLWIVQSRAIQELGSAVHPKRAQSPNKEVELRDISTICRVYRVPPTLKWHLLRVAAVGSVIADNWSGPRLDKERLLKALLLHDIGNIVKADYRKNIALFPEELHNLNYWIAVQEMTRERFGDSDVTASLNMARDIGVDDSVLKLIEQKQFILNEETADSNNWERKIGAYADQRVAPQGVMTLQSRLDEARSRYRGIEKASVNSPQFEMLQKCAFRIEQQLAEFATIPLAKIDDQYIVPAVETLRSAKLF